MAYGKNFAVHEQTVTRADIEPFDAIGTLLTDDDPIVTEDATFVELAMRAALS